MAMAMGAFPLVGEIVVFSIHAYSFFPCRQYRGTAHSLTSHPPHTTFPSLRSTDSDVEKQLALRMLMAEYHLAMALHSLGLRPNPGGWVTPPPSRPASPAPAREAASAAVEGSMVVPA